MSTFDAIVPAGGTIDPVFAAKVGTDHKAMIAFEGKTILESTLRALRDSGVIRNIVVIGSKEIQTKASDFAAIGLDPGTSGPENIFRGLDKLVELNADIDHVLIVTCDLPFLSGDLIRRYIEMCPTDKDICVPVIDADAFNQTYPGTSSTFVRTKDGTFTLGGMFLMNARKLPLIRSAIERVFARRKSKMGMALMLGPVFVSKWLSKTLTIADLERKIQSMLGCTGKAIRGAPAELAYDIDFLDDYEYAAQLVEARA